MKKNGEFHEFIFSEIVKVLDDFIGSFRKSEGIELTYTIALDGIEKQYNIDVIMEGNTYKYCMPYPAAVMNVYDLLANINDDIIYYLYSKHICEIRRNII